MNLVDERRRSQLDFLKSNQEIEVGEKEKLPMPLTEILKIDENSPYVEKEFKSGLTAYVYKLKINDKYYTLKRKREKILVLNDDGQTSFLNEVQRRRDFENLKKADSDKFSGIVDTVYASLNHGIILSEWIEGDFITSFSVPVFESIYSTLFEVEKAGLFECDLSSPNLLIDENNQVHFFDFGYMYPYNPLVHYNSDGMKNSVFHCAERLESRFLMQYLLELEDKKGLSAVLDIFRLDKEVALCYYEKKLSWLEQNDADKSIINWQKNFIHLWQNGLKNADELQKVYELESFRSYILDVHDDLSGKSCTPATLQKAKKLIEKIKDNYLFFKENNGLFWGDEMLDKTQLIEKYTRWQKEAKSYQL